MKIADIMTRSVVSVHVDDTLQRIHAIFEESKFHHVIVIDDGRIAGVISDRDLLKNVSPFIGRRLMEREQDTKTMARRAHQIMTRRPVVARPDLSIPEAVDLLLKHQVSCLPVAGTDRRVQGILTWRDILSHGFGVKRESADAA
ncbi:MAG: CBS domain-containing protein [Phycisphaerales bacterium]|nr:MAG: CBS domain-containing protein [Phycisphaerales bacterium]